jgi:tetratricopeptide (TPR) repeat protein
MRVVTQTIERLLVWLAGLVAAAAIVAVAVTTLPELFPQVSWLHRGPAGGHAPSSIDDAEQALAAGNRAAALADARQAVQENPGDAVIDNRAGNVALRAGDAAAAERYYRAGEDADAHYPWNFVELGQLYEREGKKELADAQLRVAAAAAPDEPFIHYDLGVVEMEEGLYAAALADFETELRRSPTYRAAMIGRAEALEKLGKRGEALALYRKVGVGTAAGASVRPKLQVRQLSAPHPASPSPAASAPALAGPTARPAHHHRATATKFHLKVGPASPTPPEVAAAAASPPGRPPWETPQPQVGLAPGPGSSVTPTLAAQARSYVLDVTQDLGFTHTLPDVDANQSTESLRTKLNFAVMAKPPDVASILRVGAAALLSGRVDLAETAFQSAADLAPADWRGPYFAGLTAQAQGEMDTAAGLFARALLRAQRAEIYTSLAVVDAQRGNFSRAATEAAQAVALNPSYEPARFLAGMFDLMQADLRGAQANLQAAQALGGAPARTAYFLSAASAKS